MANGDSKYDDLYDALELMEVGDCLQWDIPAQVSWKSFVAMVSNHVRGHTDHVVRSEYYNNRAFITRIN